MLERATCPRPHIGESLPPSILPVLDQLGLRDRVESAAFLRPDRSLVQWGTRGKFVKFVPNERGFQVDRDRFDALLLAAAYDAGVQVIQRSGVARVDTATDGPPIARVTDGTAVQARFLVDAAGRTGVLPRKRRRMAPSTAALYAYWADVPLQGSETRVEAGASAWYWGAPLPSGLFNATVFVDARRCRALSTAARDTLYRALLGESALLSGCLRGRAMGPLRVCDATAFADDCPVTGATILAGEAAFAIDPLSSQGVQIAMTCGVEAAAVVHTTLHVPQQAALAQRFYRERVRETAIRHAALARDAYATADLAQQSPFWSARSVAETAGPHASPLRPVCAPEVVVLSPLARLEPVACARRRRHS